MCSRVARLVVPSMLFFLSAVGCRSPYYADQGALVGGLGGAGVGGAGRMRLVTLDSIRVGSAAAFDLMGCALNLESVQATGIEMRGLLGLNFLKSFHMVLDFERNVLTLSDPAGVRRNEGVGGGRPKASTGAPHFADDTAVVGYSPGTSVR